MVHVLTYLSEFIQLAGVLGTIHDVHVSRWFFCVKYQSASDSYLFRLRATNMYMILMHDMLLFSYKSFKVVTHKLKDNDTKHDMIFRACCTTRILSFI